MHDCRKLRERVIDEFDVQPETLTAEAAVCIDCGRFLRETLAMFRAVDGVSIAETPGAAWQRFEAGFRRRLAVEPRPRFKPLSGWIDVSPRWRRLQWAVLGAAAAAVVLAVGVGRFGFHRSGVVQSPAALSESPLPLDAQTVEFLGRSEMFLRTFSKIEPSDMEDVRDARARARAQLTALAARKADAAAVPPVWSALEDYETVLREIKNLDDASASQDVRDIQTRIARRGLIATMKGYQPHVERIAYAQGR